MADNTVFVFGSNEQGFHGAGSAGYAMRGDAENTWRADKDFLAAIKSPVGSPLRKGKLAEYGIGRGFQEGKEGKSYAICTVTRPGARKSISLEDIFEQICELLIFAQKHPEYCFLCTPVGCGYAGYSSREMMGVWKAALETFPVGKNVVLPDYHRVQIQET